MHFSGLPYRTRTSPPRPEEPHRRPQRNDLQPGARRLPSFQLLCSVVLRTDFARCHGVRHPEHARSPDGANPGADRLGRISCAASAQENPAAMALGPRNAPPKRGISAVWKWVRPRRLNLSSVKEANRQPFVTTGAGAGYLPTGNLPIGALPTGAGAGGGGCLRGRSAAAAALSIAKDAAAAVSIFSMM